MGMNSDSGRVNELSGRVSPNRLGFVKGMGRAQLLAESAVLASWAVGLHMGGGRLGHYTGCVRREGRKARLGRLGFVATPPLKRTVSPNQDHYGVPLPK
jgi:hypothetical protein